MSTSDSIRSAPRFETLDFIRENFASLVLIDTFPETFDDDNAEAADAAAYSLVSSSTLCSSRYPGISELDDPVSEDCIVFVGLDYPLPRSGEAQECQVSVTLAFIGALGVEVHRCIGHCEHQLRKSLIFFAPRATLLVAVVVRPVDVLGEMLLFLLDTDYEHYVYELYVLAVDSDGHFVFFHPVGLQAGVWGTTE